MVLCRSEEREPVLCRSEEGEPVLCRSEEGEPWNGRDQTIVFQVAFFFLRVCRRDFRRRGITQKKEYNTQNTAKV